MRLHTSHKGLKGVRGDGGRDTSHFDLIGILSEALSLEREVEGDLFHWEETLVVETFGRLGEIIEIPGESVAAAQSTLCIVGLVTFRLGYEGVNSGTVPE